MSLKEVLIDEMRDLYSAENQQLKAGPKVLKQVSDSNMKQLLTEHLQQTKEQVLRLRQAFEHLGKKPTGKHCSGMEGCIKEVTEALEEDEEGALKDAGIIGASLRTEHYEVAGYNAAIAMAKSLKEADIVELLSESLREEQAAAKGILSGAKSILKAAVAQEEEDEDDEEEDDKDPEEQESEEKSEEDERDAAPVMNSKKSAGKKSTRSKK
jgi:ferritin-like metal-binding protein YciE